MNQSRITMTICLVIVLISMMIAEDGSFVLASGKKKFLKGFILGALLSSKGSHYPSIIYSVPSHGGGHGGHGGGYGGW